MLHSVSSALLKQIPTVLILMVLAGLAAWGYWNDWKIPAFAKLGISEQEAKEKEEAEKQERGKGLTNVEADLALAAACGAGAFRCRPTDGPRIVFSSEEAVNKAGLKTAKTSLRPMEQSLTAVGQLDFDRMHYAVLAPRAAGTVWYVFARPGEAVKRGQTLSLIESPDVGRAKTEFLTSLIQVDTRADVLRGLESVGSLIPDRQIREARAGLREARIKLSNDQQALVNLGLNITLQDVAGLKEDEVLQKVSSLGVPESMVREMHEDGMTANLLPLKAPFDGVIVSMRKSKGEAVGPTEPQFVLADLRKLWLILNLRQDDAGQVKLGQEVFFRAAGMNEDVIGKLAWISPEADEKTRLVQVRADLSNDEGKLRPRTFGAGRIVVEKNPSALTVPDAALQTDEGVQYVFVRLNETTFQARRVQIGAQDDGFTEITRGVSAIDKVVTKGSHVLKSELFKDRIKGDD